MLATPPCHLAPSPRSRAPALALVLGGAAALSAACAGDPSRTAGSRLRLDGDTAQARHAIEASALTGLVGDDDDFSPELDPDFDWDGDDFDDVGPTLAPHLSRHVSRVIRRLRDDGHIADTDWHLGQEPPGGHTYARVEVDDDDGEGLMDGYRTAAWVPVDATGRPAGDDVYMVRQGGVAGWQFTAGPFTLPYSDGIELGLEDAGRPLRVPAHSRLVVRLPCREGGSRRWRPTAGALPPTGTELLAAEQELVATYELGQVAEGTYALALSQDDSVQDPSAATFYVPLTILAQDDDLATDGADTW